MTPMIPLHFEAAIGGLLIDTVVGDPTFFTHPVIWIARLAHFIEHKLYAQTSSALSKRIRGTILAFTVLAIVYTATAYLIWLAHLVNPWLGIALNVWLLSTTIAAKGLDQAGKRVLRPLQEGNLSAARIYTGYIVSRETDHLDEPELVRATVETIAENIVDAVVSPLFFGILGGAPLALLYRAANTLDSLFGYKNDRYLDFGYASARIDDVLNVIPARITLVLLALAALFLHSTPAKVIRMVHRDAKKHPSPNSGIPESACAAILGVRLGGENRYHGSTHFRAYLGDPIRPLNQQTIIGVTHILWTTVILLFAICFIGIII
ncbi:MAG: adenosylcobinamide-phosphate synthase CbiB [Acidibacillus sp.]|nr:adenosylcobinamide-phosphate synthase CbiB [Acidibacillus sp.]